MQPKRPVSVKPKRDALSDGVPSSNYGQGLYIKTAGAANLSVQEVETIHCSHGDHEPGEKSERHRPLVASWATHTSQAARITCETRRAADRVPF